MTAGGLVALPGGQPARPASWEQLLGEVVRAEFQVEVYRSELGDPVLFGPSCVVAECGARGLQRAPGMRGHLCDGHARAWRRDGEPLLRAWVAERARSLRSERVAIGCAASGCRRSVHGHGLCHAHFRRWIRAGRPPLDAFAATAPAVATSDRPCRVDGCAFAQVGDHGLCDTHSASFRCLTRRRPGLAREDYVAHLARAREHAGPRFDLRGLGPVVALELGYALQVRHDQRGAAITPLIFGQVARWLREEPVDSLLIGSDAAWARAAERRFRASCRANPLGWLRFCRSALGRLRDERHGGGVWEWDTWPTDRIDTGGRYAHQPVRRIYFADIEPGWLRALVKRWALADHHDDEVAGVGGGLDQLTAAL